GVGTEQQHNVRGKTHHRCGFGLLHSLTIVACLIVVPSLYNTINEMHDQVLETVSVFRVETDSAWTQMMDFQVTPRENPFGSIFRSKRQAGLPSYCQCTPTRVTCPPGPPGPPGRPGAP
ncbi:nematode cuticle collagen domain protein, partial [Ostertagia ostertagi]